MTALSLRLTEEARLHLGVPRDRFEVLAIPLLTRGLGSSLIHLDRGQPGSVRQLRFERVGARIRIRQLNVHFGADGGAAGAESFGTSVLAVCPLIETDGDGYVLDITDLALSDLVGIAGWLRLAGQGEARVDPTRSIVEVDACRAHEFGVELEAELTIVGARGSALDAVAPDPSAVSVRQRISLTPVPQGVPARAFHPASGGYGKMRHDLSRDAAASPSVGVQPRFRLEPSAADPAVPTRPIVFSVDPDIPEPYRSAIVEGGNWWRRGFEAAGWRDAYRVEVRAPETDPAAVGINAVWWVHRTGRGWSMGAALCDPATGEIVKGNVRLGSQRVQQLTAIGEALLTPYGRPDEAERVAAIEAMTLARIRQLAAHEIGHALGFMHNYASVHHAQPSVMDYPHPRLALVDGRVSLADAYAVGLSAWDVFTVQHAYGRCTEAELAELRAQIDAGTATYLTDHDGHDANSASPDAVPWIFGSAAVADLRELLEVRSAALDDFGPGAIPPDRQPGERAERFTIAYLLHRYQSVAVARLLGGVRHSYGAALPEPVAGSEQRAALQALVGLLDPTVLRLPAAAVAVLTPPAIRFPAAAGAVAGRMGPVFDPIAAVASAAWLVAEPLFEPARLNRLAAQGMEDAAVPTIGELTGAAFSGCGNDPLTAPTAADTLARAAVAALRAEALHSIAHDALRRALLAEVYGEHAPSWLALAIDDPGYPVPGAAPTLPAGTPI